MAFPYIKKKGLLEPTFITSDIYFSNQRYKESSIFPTKKTLFEDFYVRTPNDIIDVLKNTYKGNVLNCIFNADKNSQYESMKLSNYKIAQFIEKIVCNKLLLFIYIFLHWLVNKLMIHI